MHLQLDGQGPLYIQLIHAVKDAILAGQLLPGSRLPSTRELAEELEVSRITVTNAYEQLRAEGFIESRTGIGFFVARLQIDLPKPPPAGLTLRPSRYAKRLGVVREFWVTGRRDELRLDLQPRVPLANAVLSTVWSRELARSALYTEPHYFQAQGLLELRHAVCDYLARHRGVRAGPDDVLIVNGAAQAMMLVAQVLLDTGDCVLMEDPRYLIAYRMLRAFGAQVRCIRTDGDGLVCDELPEDGAKLLFVTPSHQHPSGVVMSLPRRLALLRYAEEHASWIVEDDYDGEFRYGSYPLAALRSLDRSGRVIYIGTFSKVLFPALRLGYMVVPPMLQSSFLAAKTVSDLGSPAICQYALAHFMESGAFDRHLRKVTRELRSRRGIAVDGLRAHAGHHVELTGSHAGMHLVAWLPRLRHVDCAAMIAYARKQGLGLHSIGPHYFTPPPHPGLLIGFGGIPAGSLPEAMRLLGQCLDEFH